MWGEMLKFTFQDSNLFQFKKSGNNSDLKRWSWICPFLAESTARPENSATVFLASSKSKPVSFFTESPNCLTNRSEPRRMDWERRSQENPSGLLLLLVFAEEEAENVGLFNFRRHLKGNLRKRGLTTSGLEDKCIIGFGGWEAVVVRCMEKVGCREPFWKIMLTQGAVFGYGSWSENWNCLREGLGFF